jgi:hypothetical protein
MSRTITARTSRIWINPPPIEKENPNSHKIIRIPIMVHNIECTFLHE